MTSCIKQLLLYCLHAEYVPLVYATSEDNTRFKRFTHFFSALCKKLNIISAIYEIHNFPYGPLVELQSDRSAAMNWLNCTVQKTEFLLGIVTANPPVCTHLCSRLIKLLTSALMKLEMAFKKTIWKGYE